MQRPALRAAADAERWLRASERMKVEIHRRPTGPVTEEILSIIMDLTGEWFTADVALNRPAILLALQYGELKTWLREKQ
jgi:hypothetical protein